MARRNRIFLIVFLLGLVGVGAFWLRGPMRKVASDGWTEGQRDKVMLIESLRLQKDSERIVLETAFLDSICRTALEIDVVFAAREQAIDGESPSITHTFDCSRLATGKASELRTELGDFLAVNANGAQETRFGTLRARLIFAGEKFPRKWMLKELRVRGESAFAISEFELEKIRGSSLELEL